MIDNPEPNRPNPDVLLNHITKKEEKTHKGRLKIFFGMCAGVGKTYSMPVSYTHLRAHETVLDIVCRILLEKKKKKREN